MNVKELNLTDIVDAREFAEALGFEDKQVRNFIDWNRETIGGGETRKIRGRVAFRVSTILETLEGKLELVESKYKSVAPRIIGFVRHFEAIQVKQAIEKVKESVKMAMLEGNVVTDGEGFVDPENLSFEVVDSAKVDNGEKIINKSRVEPRESIIIDKLRSDLTKERDLNVKLSQRLENQLEKTKYIDNLLSEAEAELHVARVELSEKVAEIANKTTNRRKSSEIFISIFESPFFLAAPLVLIIAASFIHMGIVFGDNFDNVVAAWFMSFVFSTVVLVFTFNTETRGARAFILFFAVIELTINAVYFGAFGEWSSFVARFCATIALPASILAFSHLFKNYTKKLR